MLAPLMLSQDEQHTLENWAKRRSTAQDLALRARIVLASAEGHNNIAVAAGWASAVTRPGYLLIAGMRHLARKGRALRCAG